MNNKVSYEGFYFPKVIGDARYLIERVRETMEKIYSDNPPNKVLLRVAWELFAVSKSDSWTILATFDKLAIRTKESGGTVMAKGKVESSLIAFLLGITQTNPLEQHDLRSQIDTARKTGDGYAEPYPFFGIKGDKLANFTMSFSGDYRDDAVRYLEEIFENRQIYCAENHKGESHEGWFFVLPPDVDAESFSFEELTSHFLEFKLLKA